MKQTNQKTSAISHDGWERYYKDQNGAKAWGGVPDAYLLEHLDEILPASGGSVIDIASGDGRNTIPFLEKNYNVVSTDLSPMALTSFRKRCIEENVRAPTLIAGDFMSLKFIEGQFQCAVCFNSIPHFPSVPKVLEKICRLLSRGGKAAFNAFTTNDVAFGVGEKIEENKFYYKDTLFTFTSESEIKRILPATDIRIIHSETRKWKEPDHGSYRTGTHTHEACCFIIERI